MSDPFRLNYFEVTATGALLVTSSIKHVIKFPFQMCALYPFVGTSLKVRGGRQRLADVAELKKP